MGSADAARDPRGFSTKFYTEEGNLDWVYNNTPIFFIRNPSKFPLFIHTQKRNPQTNLKDPNAFWEWMVNNDECLHQTTILFSDRGTPADYRHMNGYSGHTYKWINKDGDWVYVQVHMIADQGIKTMTNDEAGKKTGENPDHAQQDLFEAIEKGDYPSWTCYVQTMTQEQAEKAPFSVFDLTKVWPHADYPLRRFGRLTLNKNPENYFAEVEQAAFAPSHTVPGWAPSADPVLQSRLFSYSDTQRYRLGVNYQQLPVNKPVCPYAPFHRNGTMNFNNYGASPNYPSSQEPLNYASHAKVSPKHEEWVGQVTNFHWPASEAAGDYKQAGALYNVLKKTDQDSNLVYNISVHLQAARPDIQDRVFSMFSKASVELGQRVREETLKRSPRGTARL